ncbi:hypothetical protein BDV32DRAFT_144335 [Aspergillus pseudonomiae]|uniref:Uncharacterized protein n=1 Tax=Aspergillus pseudonomiae TaxID=1506151 RepID=A0A5N6IGB7_9EURO|nr:uncharacterized protein BDV37DRAFT_286012 [Aspergillus pseudonomiae]KAB8265812.1 hypothetical protein BDV32DRAFT_144335 [Aspergillus pseudonomiae]KAE8401039.1 hypothetical protein BDV37DRAFT_286012 [Aspergillus pseudonomiae]
MGNSQSQSGGYLNYCDYLADILCCIACGIQITGCTRKDILNEREDWKRSARWRRHLFTTAAELEHMYFKKTPKLWSYYYRAILVDSEGDRLSGICPKIYHSKKHVNRVPTDPQRARIFGPVRKGSRNVDFRMARIVYDTEPDIPKERIGYPIHAHCWLLLDRVIGHEIVKKNLREFGRAVDAYWWRNLGNWGTGLWHHEDEMLFYGTQAGHLSCYGKPATRECTDVHLRGHSAIVDLPLDIAILIVDLIYGSRPRSMERLIDTRNLLEAFQWKLPETYWKTRCDYWLVFEMDDLIREKRALNWSRFCLGLELLLERGWYCNSGLRTRQRALTSLGGIKEHFLNMIEK